jgi:hypothetical protein
MKGAERYTEGSSVERAVVGTLYRWVLYAVLGGFVVVGLGTGLVLADPGERDRDTLLAVYAGHLTLGVFWPSALYSVRRRGRLIGLDAVLLVAGPLVAYFAAAGLTYLQFGRPPGLG